ncbi:MAG: hypothetical protein ACTSVU_01935, partial [Promethearchaeota archaeon]
MKKKTFLIILLILFIANTPSGSYNQHKGFKTNHKLINQQTARSSSLSNDNILMLNTTTIGDYATGNGTTSQPYLISGISYNSSNYLGIILGNLSYVSFKDCYFSIQGAESIGIAIQIENCTNINFSTCIFLRNKITLSILASDKITINDSVFYSNVESINSYYSSDIIIENTFFSKGSYCVSIYHSNRIKISNSNFES